MKDRLTIILAVKDRLEIAHRWMRFMNQEKCPYRIIIADGSLDSNSAKTFSKEMGFSNLNYKYIRFPPDVNYSAYYKKITNAFELVDTPYVLFADDDDFFCLEGFKTGLAFLDSHEDFVCARGAYLGFSVSGKSSEYGDMKLKRVIYPSISIDDDTPDQRLISYFSSWSPHWYNIHRTHDLRECWNLVVELDIHNIFLMEHVLSALVVLRGKFFSGCYPYYYRQIDGDYVTSSSEAKLSGGDFYEQMLDKRWGNDWQASLDVVKDELVRQGINEGVAAKVVYNTFKTFWRKVISDCFLPLSGKFMSMIFCFYRGVRSMPTYIRSRREIELFRRCNCTKKIHQFMIDK